MNHHPRFVVMACLLVAAPWATGCSKEKAPLADGLELTYEVTVKGKKESTRATYTFQQAKTGDWVVSVMGAETEDDAPVKPRKVSPQLTFDDGEAARVLMFQLWIPKSVRKPNAWQDELHVKKQEAFEQWPDAWLARLGNPVRMWFDAKTGFLVGGRFRALGVDVKLVDSNLDGLLPQ